MDKHLYFAGEVPHNFWICNVCQAQNSSEDGDCQYCECEGESCARDNCDGFHGCIDCGSMEHTDCAPEVSE